MTGESGSEWRADYGVFADQRTSLVFILSTSAPGWRGRMSARVFAACSDLANGSDRGPSLVSLLDDTRGVEWREEDVALLQGVSRVAWWSRSDELERILTAA